jgi:hypothetical protein
MVTSTKRSRSANGLTGQGFPWLLPGGVGILQPGMEMLAASASVTSIIIGSLTITNQ